LRYLHPRGDLVARGLSPLLPASLALLVLSVLERSRARLAFAFCFIGVVLLANLYDVENLLPAVLGAPVPETLAEVPNVLLPAVTLLVGGLSFGFTERRA
jgi:drug/metabolite transporter (DMT)-like permease